MSADNKAIARRFFEQVWGHGDLDLSNQPWKFCGLKAAVWSNYGVWRTQWD